MKRGFSLPEVLAAILVFAVGILGLASTGTFIAIQAGEARALTEGSILAGRVVDSLRSIPCSTVVSGQLRGGQSATVRWSTISGRRSIAVNLTLELPDKRGGLRRWHIATLLPCAP